MFLTEKKDGRIKARTCANGSIQCVYIPKDNAASPTASTKNVLITRTIKVEQNENTMAADIPNAFIQTDIKKEDQNKIIMKIRGQMVNILPKLEPSTYARYVSKENNSPILYVRMVEALYGMLTLALTFYEQFKNDIEEIGFQINPYEPCVANKIVNGGQ